MMTTTNSMKAYTPYVRTLHALLSDLAFKFQDCSVSLQLDAALDGQPYRELRRLVPLKQLRLEGAFFTNATLAHQALAPMAEEIIDSKLIIDPTCGAGDLLLACARHLPVTSSLSQTLYSWGTRLGGMDKHPEFIQTTIFRLTMTAIQKGAKIDIPPTETASYFPLIYTGNVFENASMLAEASHVLINPPFTMVESPERCEWTSGAVNASAVFMEHVLNHSKGGTRIIGILPDVLRCGTRYKKWRALVEATATLEHVIPYGRFDAKTDVDVFILQATVKRSESLLSGIAWVPILTTVSTIETFFYVHVGPVVEFRHPHCGPWHPFIAPSDLTPWSEVHELTRRRRFTGKLFSPPFIAVRRTSSPGSKFRAIATIVVGDKPIAVENHLFVLLPKDGKLDTCRKLVQELFKPKTTTWLNQRIRCRHLTVSALKEVPVEDFCL